MYLSKSDFILGCSCEKALWLKKHRKDLLEETQDSSTQADTGYEVQDLAHQLFPEGKEITAQPWEVDIGAKETLNLSKKHDIIFEAVAKLDNGCFCRIDVLRKAGCKWDLVEIKSSNNINTKQVDDLAYQYYVFTQAGYKINRCYILHLNKDYVRGKKLKIDQLFKLDDFTDDVKEKQVEIAENALQLLNYQKQSKEPKAHIAKACKDCDFYDYCCADVPDYSIWDILDVRKADKVCEKLKSFDINALDAQDYKGTAKIDIEAWQKKKIHCDKELIREFLNNLIYPLYYFDYESLNPAVPMFENSKPYQQIPFQFSLHIQKEIGGDVEHISFLHKERTDPRRALVESLVKNCGKKGSIIVYFQSFEKGRNGELADLFPDLKKDIEAINERVVDLWKPFKSRALYHYKQQSSASIKQVLPSFTKLSYDNMEIHNGGEANERYLAFQQGKLTPKEEKTLFDGLEAYCGQDTYAMVLLMDVLYKKAK